MGTAIYDRSRFDIANLLANARRQADDRGFGDFTIVDVDSHHYEDQSWADMIPYIEDEPIRGWAEAMIRRAGKAGATTITGTMPGNQEMGGRILRPGRNLLADDDAATGRHPDVVRTTWAMEMMGIDYTVMFPTPMLYLGLHPQVEVEVAISRAYTRWLIEEILPQDDRIKTLVYLPFNDPDASLAMVRDFADAPGVVGFMVTSVRHRPVHHNAYAPLYAELADRGSPLAFHAAHNWYEPSLAQLNKFLSAHALGFTFCNMVHLTNMVINGIPERFPGLRLAWFESGLAWIPFLMQRLDNEYFMRSSEAPLLRRRPSEYIREMYFSSQPMEQPERMDLLAMTFDIIDAENQLLYSSDYPHWDFNVPSVIYDLPFLTEKAKRRILGENAAELFGLPTRPPDTRVAEAPTGARGVS